ncbi:MAG: insulinase family protein [Desulfobacteraceae bacterium]|nr:insulinase family protein [Desulfobacteraceae bacterium]
MYRIKLFFVLCLFFVAACAPAGKSITNTPGAPFGPEGLEPDPHLIRGGLPNGFTYLLLENANPENRVSMHLNVQAGSMNETGEQRGVAHYLEHMLFNGSTHFKPDELVEYFQSIGMSFGSDANAHTGFFETVYDIFLPAGDRDSIDQGLLVLDDFARGALLLESEVDRERGVILSEKRERDSVSYRTFEATLGFELPGSRLARRFPIGTEEVITNADRALLKGFYDTWYRPDTMVLVVVGEFDAPTVETLIKERFSGMKPRAAKQVADKDSWEGYDRDRAFYHFEPEAGNTTVSIETVMPVPFEADTLAAYKERAVRDVAEAIVRNRLSRTVRKHGSLLSDAGIYSGSFLQGVYFSAITAETPPDRWEETLGVLETSLRRALRFGFSDQELARVKADFIQELESAVKEASTRKSSQLAREIIRTTNKKQVFQSPRQKRDILVPYIRSLTLGDVARAFRDTWAREHRLVLVTGNAVIGSSNGSGADQAILGAFHRSRSQAVLPTEGHDRASFPYLPEPGTPGRIKAQKSIDDLGISVVEFDNKVKLSLKPTDYKRGEFIFKVGFGRGMKAEPENMPGLALLGASVINESGFGEIDKDQLEEALAGRNVNIHFVAGQDRFFLEGSAGPDEAALVFQLVRTYLLDPGFRADALTLAKERYRQMHKQLIGTPEGVMELEGARFLANGDSRFGLPPLEAVEAITLKDIESWMKPFFDHGGVEISVVGDVDPSTVVDAVGRYLGTLPGRNGAVLERHRPEPGFPKGKNLELTVDTALDKALVQLAFPTDDFWDIRQTRRLNLVASIFSERLRKSVREKLGASYSPYAYNDPSRCYDGYGVLRAVVGVEPDAAPMVMNEIRAIAASLAENGVTQKEVDLARKPILTHIRDAKKANGYWLESVISGSGDHPEKFEWARSMIDDYESITVEEVNALANNYCNNRTGASIVIRPID